MRARRAQPPTHDLAALLVAEDFVLITAKKKTLPLQRVK
jgi:hypothetical protein